MISVLMPTYGRPELLAEAVECFLRQTVSDCELLVANDWPDQTIVIDHPKVRVYNLSERLSLGAKRNLLNDLCSGSLVMDWDDDDIYLPAHIEHCLEMLSIHRTGLFAKQRWQWKYSGGKLCRISPAGYMHTAIMCKKLRVELGGYADQTRHSDLEFLLRIKDGGHLVGPGKFMHKPTFIQRYDSGRAHVSAGPTADESDADRHARIDREIASKGVTGKIHITPGWKRDYQQLADDSYAAVLKTGWGHG